MEPSVWSALIIFVVAPLVLAALVTTVVLLVASPSRRPEQDSNDRVDADEAETGTEDESDDPEPTSG